MIRIKKRKYIIGVVGMFCVIAIMVSLLIYYLTMPEYTVISDAGNMKYREYAEAKNATIFSAVYTSRKAVRLAEKSWKERDIDYEKWKPYEIKYDKDAEIWIVRGRAGYKDINDPTSNIISSFIGGVLAIIDKNTGYIYLSGVQI